MKKIQKKNIDDKEENNLHRQVVERRRLRFVKVKYNICLVSENELLLFVRL